MTNPRLPAFFRTALPYAALIVAAVVTIFLLDVPLAESPDGLIHVHRTRGLADALNRPRLSAAPLSGLCVRLRISRPELLRAAALTTQLPPPMRPAPAWRRPC